MNVRLSFLFDNVVGTGRDTESFSLSGRIEWLIIFHVSLSRIKIFCDIFSCGWPLLLSSKAFLFSFWKVGVSKLSTNI